MKELWKHQQQGIERALAKRDFGFLFEVGTGKTRTVIEVMRRRYAENKRLMKTLILCPKVVCSNWKREFAEYSKVNQQDIVILAGTAGKRMDMLLKTCFIKDTPQAKILVTNFEAMQMVSLVQKMWEWGVEVLVVDESHRMKSIKSKRAKMVACIAEQTKHNYILTGTPVLNSPMDLFQQFKILDRGDTFGTNFYAFRGRYFEDANAKWAGKHNYFPKWEPRADSFKELSSKIAVKSMQAKKEDCLDLPPFVRQTIEVEMGKVQAKMYEDMRKDYVAFIQGKTAQGEPLAVVATLAITKALRLQQIVSGFAKTETGVEMPLEDNPRLDALKDLLEDHCENHKVIVWAVFKENYRQIREVCKELGIEAAELHGEIEDKEEQIDKFRKDPSCRVMIANQGAGGIGISLIESDISIYFSKGFSLEHDLQSEARNHRGGSEIHKKITRIDLVCRGTIDELINEALAKKQNVSELVLTNYGKKE